MQSALWATRLRSDADELVESFRRTLLASDTIFATSEMAREQAQGQLRLIIEDIAAGLCDQRSVGSPPGAGLSREIGLDRAREQIPPQQSLIAAGILSRLVLGWAMQQTENEPGLHVDSLGGLLTELNASVVQRITEASTWYASYLMHKVVHAHRDERRRIARDLHDQVSYGLVEAKVDLESHRAASGDTEANEAIDRSIDRLSTSLNMISRVIRDLRAETTELGAALRRLSQESARARPPITVEITGDEVVVPAATRAEAFIIIREAVRNALRHSCATAVRVAVEVTPRMLTALVDDDGSGYRQSDRAAGTERYGIVGMIERAELLGGALTVADRPGGGTRVTLRVPLHPAAGAEA